MVELEAILDPDFLVKLDVEAIAVLFLGYGPKASVLETARSGKRRIGPDACNMMVRESCS